MGDGDELRLRHPRGLDREEHRPPAPARRRQRTSSLRGGREHRLGLGVLDVADPGATTGSLLSTMTIRRRPAPDGAPAPERAYELGDVPRQALAGRAEPRAAPALGPAVGVHEAAQDLAAGPAA